MVDISMVSNAQILQWAKGIGGAGNENGNSVAIDANGNVYATGYFTDTVDFDPGTITNNLVPTGSFDMFVTKFNSYGNLVWARRIGGYSQTIGKSITIDTSKNVYITGSFEDTVDFDPGAGIYNLIGGVDETFIFKLDSNGDFVWAKKFSIGSFNMATDYTGNVYVCGTFGGIADFDPGPGIFYLTPVGGNDIFILKLDFNGNFVWVKGMGGNNSDYAISMAIGENGSVYTTGTFQSTVDFDPNSGVYNIVSSSQADLFISKLDSNGNFVWAKSVSSTVFCYSQGIAADINGNTYITGFFRGITDFDPGAGTFNLTSTNIPYSDIYILRLDSAGNLGWIKRIGGSHEGWGKSIAVDFNKNVYVTGWFNGTADFDPGSGIYNLTASGIHNVYISMLDSNGIFKSAKCFNGDYQEGNSIAAYGNGNVCLTGFFTDTMSLNSSGFSDLISHGGNDIFIAKFGTTNLNTKENTLNNNHVIFPNPVRSDCSILAKEFNNSTLILWDITGRVLLYQSFNQKAELDLSKYQPGLYVVELRDKEGRSVNAKLIKQ